MKYIFITLILYKSISTFSQSFEINQGEIYIELNAEDGTLSDSIQKVVISNKEIRNYNKLFILNAHNQLPAFIRKLDWMKEVTLVGVYKPHNGDTVIANFIISDEFNQFNSLKHLTFYAVGIKEVKSNFKINSLDSLAVIYDIIETIPKPFFGCQNIEKLILSRNKIKEIPKEISSLKKLITLNLFSNELKIIPEELFSVTSLRYVFLDSNEIELISDAICQLKNLNNLSATGNPIISVPACIYSMQNLRWFGVDLDGASFGDNN